MTDAEAERFCEQRKAEVDRWEKVHDPIAPDKQGPWVAAAYWQWNHPPLTKRPAKMNRRIHKVGRTLIDVVEQCQRAETEPWQGINKQGDTCAT